MALTVCRSKSHDLHYFRHPDQMTGDVPPPPFISKAQALPARRLIRKAWLAAAFARLRDECTERGEPFPADDLTPPDVHGEFVPTSDYFEPGSVWPDRLRRGLEGTAAMRDVMASLLAEDGPLEAAHLLDGLSVDDLLRDLKKQGF